MTDSLQTKHFKTHNINKYLTDELTTLTTLLGRYEIDSEIGRGAMGVVYRGRDPKIDRLVAIKTISIFEQDFDEEQAFRDRFFQEAKAAGGLSHPGIVTIFDVGEEPESRLPYIVMEYVEGRPLNRILGACENHKLPLGPALQLVQEIAEALHYAHGRGVIHRDIKPANILITREGHAKVADFGIAKLNHTQMTLPGRVLGSPAYMAPEQLAGEKADARSDLFSLGVILYTIITGYRPFQGNSAATIISKVAHHDPVPVTVLEAGFPQALNRIASRALTKDPARRYQTGAEMAADIQQLRTTLKLLNETAGSLAVISRDSSVVATSSKALPLSIFGKPTKIGEAQVPARSDSKAKTGLHRQSAAVASSRTRSIQVALAMVALVIVAIGLGLHLRHPKTPERSVIASASVVPTPVPNPEVNRARSPRCLQLVPSLHASRLRSSIIL